MGRHVLLTGLTISPYNYEEGSQAVLRVSLSYRKFVIESSLRTKSRERYSHVLPSRQICRSLSLVDCRSVDGGDGCSTAVRSPG